MPLAPSNAQFSGLAFPQHNLSKVEPWLSQVAISTGVFAGTVVADLLINPSFSVFLGLGILITPFQNISNAMSYIFNQHSNLFYASQFFLSAAVGILSGFIGLAGVSLFTAAMGNPFTLPAILCASVSAAIILGAGIFVCQQFKTTKGMTQFLGDLFNPVTTFFTGDINDRFKDIKELGQENSFEERRIPLMP